MAARTPSAALAALVQPLQRQLSCVSRAVFVRGGHDPQRGPYALGLSGGPFVPLAGPADIQLPIVLGDMVLGQPDGGWLTEIVYYYFDLLAVQRSLVSWHWHPIRSNPVRFPHVHTPGYNLPLDMSHVHIPSGPITLDMVLRCAISELGVQPLRADWDRVLTSAVVSQEDGGGSPRREPLL